MYKDFTKKRQAEYCIACTMIVTTLICGVITFINASLLPALFWGVIGALCGCFLGRCIFTFAEVYRYRTQPSFQVSKTELLHEAARNSDASEAFDLILAGAKASDLKERTIRHSVRRVRNILKFFRAIGR